MAMSDIERRSIFDGAVLQATQDGCDSDMAEAAGLAAVESATMDRAIATVTRTIQGGTDPMLTVGAYIVKALQDMKEGEK